MATTPANDGAGNHDAGVVPLGERPEFIAWLTASCRSQEVAVTVTDPIVLGRIATLLGADRSESAVQTRHTGATRAMSRLRDPGVPGAITA